MDVFGSREQLPQLEDFKPPKLEVDEVSICDCESGSGCGDDCFNRKTYCECVRAFCKNGASCSNNRFQKREWAPTRVRHYENKGWGLCSSAFIARESFVVEYVGEVVDEQQTEERMAEYCSYKNFYLMNLTSGLTVDATKEGNKARFLNHSCDPNCEIQKWWVNGLWRVGIFALRDIPEDEEVTVDYKFERFGNRKQRCFCGTARCRGFLGAKPKKGQGGADEVDVDVGAAGDNSSKKVVARQGGEYYDPELHCEKQTAAFFGPVRHLMQAQAAQMQTSQRSARSKKSAAGSIEAAIKASVPELPPSAPGTLPCYLQRNVIKASIHRTLELQQFLEEATGGPEASAMFLSTLKEADQPTISEDEVN